jgi:hypothetical protein
MREHPFQDQASDIIVQSSLPQMPKDPAAETLRPAVGRTGHVLAAMPPKIETLKASAGPNDRVMTPFIIGPERARTATAKAVKNDGHDGAMTMPLKDMEAHQTPAAAHASPGEGYIRLRVRVTDDRMRILNAQTVEGPLAQPTAIVGQHAYEVVLDSQRIAAEGIADIGIQRSFPRPGQHEHHITELPSFEFNVRVPKAAVPAGALSRLRINLYRLPDSLPKPIAERGLLSQQLGTQAQVIARIEGIASQHLDTNAVEQLRKIFPSANIR